MRTNLFLILILTIFLFDAQAQSWQWGKSTGSIYEDDGNFIKIDNHDNIYVGSNSIGQNTEYYVEQDSFLVSGLDDIFVSKYNSSGQVQWTRQFGGYNGVGAITIHESIYDMIIDTTSSYLYIYGVFTGTSIFGSDTLSTPANQSRMFLSKLDLNGNCIWTRSFGSSSYNVPGALSLNTDGDIFLTGTISPMGYFDTLSIAPGGFLAKFTSSGNRVFVKKIFSSTNNPMASVMHTSIRFYNDSLYITGNNGADTVTIDATTFVPDGNGIVITCFDTTGVLLWAKFAGSPFFVCPGEQTLMDQNGDLVITGLFTSGTSYFDGDTFTSTSPLDMFVSKFDRNGNKIWAKQMKSDNTIICNQTSFDSDNNLYITGGFKGTTIFGADTLIAVSSEDLFVVRIDTGGNCIDVIQKGDAMGHSIINNATGSFYVTGTFSNSVSFGASSLTSLGSTDVFVAKYDLVTDIEEGARGSLSNQLFIYANPNKGTFNIKIPETVKTLEDARLVIYDNSGRVIKDFPLSDLQPDYLHFDITKSSAGLYTVHFIQGDRVYVGKLIVE